MCHTESRPVAGSHTRTPWPWIYNFSAKHARDREWATVSAVPVQDPIKLIRLRLRNIGPQQRRLSATFFVEWVLGVTCDRSAMHVVTELDPDTGALLARNAFQEDFGRRVAFADVNRRPTTCDRRSRGVPLARHGSTTRPTAFDRVALSGRTGAALDPCAAIQTTFLLEPQESIELIFVLGEAADLELAHALIRKYWEPGETEKAIGRLRQSGTRSCRLSRFALPTKPSI